jgi:hypothetical protein
VCGTRGWRKAESLAKWKGLPDAEGGGGGKQRSERFRALPLEKAHATFLGVTRAKRTGELLAAALSGNLLRLEALIAAGVDVDAVNEVCRTAYGTAVKEKCTFFATPIRFTRISSSCKMRF